MLFTFCLASNPFDEQFHRKVRRSKGIGMSVRKRAWKSAKGERPPARVTRRSASRNQRPASARCRFRRCCSLRSLDRPQQPGIGPDVQAVPVDRRSAASPRYCGPARHDHGHRIPDPRTNGPLRRRAQPRRAKRRHPRYRTGAWFIEPRRPACHSRVRRGVDRTTPPGPRR
jgi:hypothetical protein